jgi:hypothetical protein
MRDAKHGSVKRCQSRNMKFVAYLDMNKLFALSASVIRRLSTADRIITP